MRIKQYIYIYKYTFTKLYIYIHQQYIYIYISGTILELRYSIHWGINKEAKFCALCQFQPILSTSAYIAIGNFIQSKHFFMK